MDSSRTQQSNHMYVNNYIYSRTKSVSDIIHVYEKAAVYDKNIKWYNPKLFPMKYIGLTSGMPSSIHRGLGATAPSIPRKSPQCIEMGMKEDTRNTYIEPMITIRIMPLNI